MGLLHNIAVLNAEPMTYIGAGGSGSPIVVASTQCMDLARVGCYHGKELNLFFSYADQLDSDSHSQLQKSGLPYGYTPPYQFVLPVKGGAMTAQTEIAGTGSMTAYLIKGGNIAAASPKIIGVGSLVANAFLGYYMQALAPKITGVGTITTSLTKGINLDPDDLIGEGSIDANQGIVAWWRNELLQGDGSISSADIDVMSLLRSSVTGGGDISSVNLSALASLLGSLQGDGDITTASLSGVVRLLASLLGEGDIEDSQLQLLTGCLALLEGIGTLEGGMQLPVGMSSSIVGEGTVVANMVGLAILLAALEGDSTLDADFRAMAQLATGMTGSGDLVNPLLKGIAWCVADLLGEGTASGSIRSDGYMSANIKVSGDLVTAESCASAVWNALAAAYDNTGSMGKYLGDLGAGANPWDSVIEGTHTAQDVLRYLLAFIGGTTAGAGTEEITFTSTGGTKVRIRMNVSDEGDRSLVILDGSNE